jgi:hypothetical protein
VTGPLASRRRVFSLSEPSVIHSNGWPQTLRKLYRWIRPCFSGRDRGASTAVAAACVVLGGPPRPGSQAMYSTPHSQPNSQTWGQFRPVFSAPEVLELGASLPVTPASTGSRSAHSGTLSGSVRRDRKPPGTERSKARTTPSRPSRISTSS